ncbi:MAG: hypothetical protein KAH77_08805, partial [Thiomargarita sp.]|nr:hypothetical protein [Thiomargarita sp.]
MTLKHKLLSAGISVALGVLPMTALADLQINIGIVGGVPVLQETARILTGQTIDFTESAGNALGEGTLVFKLSDCASFETADVDSIDDAIRDASNTVQISEDDLAATNGKLEIGVGLGALQAGVLHIADIHINTSECAIGDDIQISLDPTTNLTGNATFTPVTIATVVNPAITISNEGTVPKIKAEGSVSLNNILLSENAASAIESDGDNTTFEIIMTLPTDWVFASDSDQLETGGLDTDDPAETNDNVMSIDVTTMSSNAGTIILGGSIDMRVTAPTNVAFGEHTAMINVILSDGTTVNQSIVIANVVEYGVTAAAITHTVDTFDIDTTPNLENDALPNLLVGTRNMAVPNIRIVEVFYDDLIADDTLTLTLPAGVVFANNAVAIDTSNVDATISSNPDTVGFINIDINDMDADTQGGILLHTMSIHIPDTFAEAEMIATLTGTVNGTTFSPIPVTLANMVTTTTELTPFDADAAIPTIGIGDTGMIRLIVITENAPSALSQFETITLTLPEQCSWVDGGAGNDANITVTSGSTSTENPQVFTFEISSNSSEAAGTISFGGRIQIDPEYAPGSVEMTVGGTAGATVETIQIATAAYNTTTTLSDIPALETGTTNQDIAHIVITEELVNGMSSDGTGTFTLLLSNIGIGKIQWNDIAPTVLINGIDSAGWAVSVNQTWYPQDTLTITVPAVLDDNILEEIILSGLQVTIYPDATIETVDIKMEDVDVGFTESTQTVAIIGTADPLVANNADIVVSAEMSQTVTFNGGLGDLSISIVPDTDISTATIVDDVLTITGIAEGNTSVVISDSAASVQTVTVNITVTGAIALPSLPACSTLSGAECHISFAGGATADGGNTYPNIFTNSDVIGVRVEFMPAASEVGQNADIYVVASLSGTWFMRKSDAANPGTWVEWNLNPNDLERAYNTVLTETTSVLVVEGLTALSGTFDV